MNYFCQKKVCMDFSVDLHDYHYDLPDERIAKFPLADRAASKLLYFHGGRTEHKSFADIATLLPPHTSLYFNNTRVIPARLHFARATGAAIEIFLLQPLAPTSVISLAMESTGPVTWKCMIGNAKRWKNDRLERMLTVQGKPVKVFAEKLAADEVRLSWDKTGARFVDVVEALGQTPLPPYLNREPTESDKNTYQTVYSEKEGAVAAPTAGLHFTDEILATLVAKGIKTSFLTLHVSAGTFQPIKAERVEDHNMHSEQVIVKRENVLALLERGRFVVAVGTTSMRTMESLYWFGVLLLQNSGATFHIPKLYPYGQQNTAPSLKDSLEAVLKKMDTDKVDELVGTTEIFIFPGYQFRVVQGLVTNFHQPGSTLILLVAAFVGESWRGLYEEALANGYRFLSYGDSSLLVPER